MKKTFLEEAFLMQYFALEAIIKPINKPIQTDLTTQFRSLALVFGITDKEELDRLYKVTCDKDVAEIVTYEDYARTMRVLDYSAKYGNNVELPKELLTVIGCKGRGLLLVSELQSALGRKPTREYTLSILSKGRESMNVLLYGLIGFMLLEGIVVDKNSEEGLEYAWKCARWNDVFGLLLLLHYDKTRTKDYLALLKGVLDCSLESGLYRDYLATFPEWETTAPAKEAILMAKYLNGEKENRNTYNYLVSRIVHSTTLSIEDKRRIVLSKDKILLQTVNELPLGSGRHSFPIPKIPLFSPLLAERRDEAEMIGSSLFGQKVTKKAKPLLITCPDGYIKADYVQAISNAYGNKNVYCVSGKNLNGADLHSSRDHFVISRLMTAGTTDCVFIIDEVEELSYELVGEFIKLLSYETKSQFRLQELRLTINLENCVFILLADRGRVNSNVSELCQCIDATALNKDEKKIVVEQFVDGLKKQYSCEEAEFDTSAIEALCALDYDNAEKTIIRLCQKYMYAGEKHPCISSLEVEKNTEKKGSTMGFVIRRDLK